ncbi:MAG: hypothetical protein V3R94_05840 [Acidobacteriota bacterium]
MILVLLLLTPSSARAQDPPDKARDVIAAAIEAMGGQNYLGFKNYHRQGRYFIFDKRGRQGFSQFLDWTVLKPIKWRFQLGEGKRREVTIYNLELMEGWSLEGKNSVEEVSEKELMDFEKDVLRDIDVLLRSRVEEEGMHLYYYGSDEVTGSGEVEAVEFLDATNSSVVIFFDLQNHLPTKLETTVTNPVGIRQKKETEFYNWHTIQGIHTPLRTDHFTDGEKSQQIFVEEISYNVAIPASHFLEPVVEK